MNKYKLKNYGFDIEPHEVFLDTLAHTEEEKLGISEKKFEVPLKEKISYFLFAVFFLLAVVLYSKTFYLQIFEGKRMFISAENNKGSLNMIVPERGIIYDRNLKKLVSNVSAFDLVCDRAHFSLQSSVDNNLFINEEKDILKEIEIIATATEQIPPDVLNKILSSDASQVLVAEDIQHKNLLLLETKINELPACYVLENTKRSYFDGPIFSQILGYTGRINKEEYTSFKNYAINDYIGKSGLEKYYETYLRGQPGQSRPKVGSSEDVNEVLSVPKAGENLILNIDADLQINLYNALEQRLKDIGAEKGAAVAMNPNTGAVLAIVSYPSYDNNIFSSGISKEDFQKILEDPNQPFFNRAISAKYPTGSTIKPLEASAALQEKLISPKKEINDQGYIEIRSKYDPSVVYTFKGVKPHGWVDMKKAIAVSSNVYFYTIGGGYGDQKGLGPNRIKKYLSLFGWDQKTGIDLPGEFSGFIPDPEWKKKVKNEQWWDGDTYNLSIGQSDLQTTPLQVASAYCAIANGGTLYQPQIIKEIISGTGQDATTIKELSPQIIRSNFIDKENLEIVREGMRDGVAEDYGSSKILRNLPVSVGAKTGTAEIGYKDKFNLWSSVFAPYENPEIVLVVTAENVQGLGSVTLPVARDVLNWYFSRK